MKETYPTKILGLVTLYHPKAEEAADNILQYINDLDKLIIWDNSPLEENLNEILPSLLGKDRSKVIWKGDGQNHYIASAINFAWFYARNNHYDLILIMDQDSRWNDFHSFKNEVVRHCQSSYNHVYCPYIIGNDDLDGFIITKDLQEKRIFINSGTVIPTSILNAIGGADESFPLDALDHDLAIRIQKAGYTIICLTKHKLNHSVGDPQLMGPFHIYTDNYGPQRIYSISKCHIIKIRKHKDWLTFPEIKKTITTHYILKFLRILLAEPQKTTRFKMLFKGIYDGLTYHITKT